MGKIVSPYENIKQRQLGEKYSQIYGDGWEAALAFVFKFLEDKIIKDYGDKPIKELSNIMRNCLEKEIIKQKGEKNDK